jgi:diguanylate cyclase (GGDEF)-like protein
MENTPREKANILVVDDIPENLTILTNILTERGYTVRPAINGQIALKAARHVPPDLILLDIMMPGMDGYEVCRQLKASEQTREIPVIFISALDDAGDKIKAFERGGVDYVTKPFEAGEVIARVENHLALRRMQRQLQAQNFQLQQEIQERTRMEAALRQYNQELSLMNTMSSLLQSCRSEADMDSILTNCCEQLFPADSGYLAMLDEAGNFLHQRCAWGGYRETGRSFSIRDYPLLASDALVDDEEQRAGELGILFEPAPADSKRCLAITISTAETMFGAFVIIYQQGHDLETSKQNSAMKWMVANSVVEHYSLALANIRLREVLRLEAIRDPLTGLFNRRYMEEALQREAHRADRNHAEIGILMLDIDHFKALNDAHGHDAGDVVLEHLGELLTKSIRGGDIACRYGGEEFLVILRDISSNAIEQRAYTLLEQIRALRIPYQEQQFLITVSIGVAMFPKHGSDVQHVVTVADGALYRAKHQGRDQFVIAASVSTDSPNQASG